MVSLCEPPPQKQKSTDHTMIIVMNSPDGNAYKVRLYGLRGSYIAVYYNYGINSPVKAIRYSLSITEQIPIHDLSFTNKGVKYNDTVYLFQKQTWVGPLNSHPNPIPLPPLPTPKNKIDSICPPSP